MRFNGNVFFKTSRSHSENSKIHMSEDEDEVLLNIRSRRNSAVSNNSKLAQSIGLLREHRLSKIVVPEHKTFVSDFQEPQVKKKHLKDRLRSG